MNMEKDEFKEFPTLLQAKESIKKLKKYKFPKYDGSVEVNEYVDHISKLLANEFGVLANIMQFFEQKEININIFRVRELDSFSNINLFREHSYPPLDKVGMGRCNFPKYPVFYCSDDPITALVEVVKLNRGENKKYCISKWEISPTNSELIFQSFLQIDLPPENLYNILKNGFKEKLDIPFENKLDNDRKDGMLECLKFLDNSFITDNDYSISASLAHRTLFSKHDYKTDILLYPSVRTGFKGVNMAIHPNFVDNNMVIKRLYIVKLDNYNVKDGKTRICFTKYAEIEKNHFKWNNISPEDKKWEKFTKEDFGHYMNSNFISTFEKIS